jgi:signal peptidase II
MNPKLRLPLILVAIIIIVDQALKIWIKTNLELNDVIPMFGDWGFLLYTENPGMAFGYKFGGETGKVILTLFRIFAVVGISWYLVDLAKKNSPKGLLISFGLILAGAIGNIIDSSIYGLIFDSGTTFNVELGRWQEYSGVSALNFEGYAPLFKGCVVDMFYFPLIEGHFPSWFPIWGGESFTFFRPVFNVADSAITLGVASILIFHRRFFKHASKNNTEEAVEVAN